MRVIFAAILFLLLRVVFLGNHYAKRTANGFQFAGLQINLVNEETAQTLANFANQPAALFFGFSFVQTYAHNP